LRIGELQDVFDVPVIARRLQYECVLPCEDDEVIGIIGQPMMQQFAERGGGERPLLIEQQGRETLVGEYRIHV
jgi:hypothetical protein